LVRQRASSTRAATERRVSEYRGRLALLIERIQPEARPDEPVDHAGVPD
jgi:hypothetical protein